MSQSSKIIREPTHLGDGAYVKPDGWSATGCCIYTSDGRSIINEVWFEPAVVETFLRWLGFTDAEIRTWAERETATGDGGS